MTLRFDEKGKYFTDYVTKESTPVVIQTVTHNIRGYVYVQEEGRLSDELNSLERFLPVTQAAVFDLTGNIVAEVPFLAVNREHLIWIYPEEVPTPEDNEAVEALLTGDDPLVSSEEIYIVENTVSATEMPEENLEFDSENADVASGEAEADDSQEHN
jgi:hypothetical protein